MRILIIEDEKRTSDFLCKSMEAKRYAVDRAFDGEDGLGLATTCEYDMVILDLILPKKEGIQVLDELRRKGKKTPVLIITGRNTVEDKVKVLDAGGDDYLTKPFSIEEFLARVRALLRRGNLDRLSILRAANLTVNPATQEVFRGDRKVNLTHREYALLEYLIRNKGKALTRHQIADQVWNIDFDTETNIIDVYITHLRNKIDKGEAYPIIKTVRGAGYMLGE